MKKKATLRKNSLTKEWGSVERISGKYPGYFLSVIVAVTVIISLCLASNTILAQHDFGFGHSSSHKTKKIHHHRKTVQHMAAPEESN